MMNHVNSDMTNKMTRVARATMSPCAMSAPRPYGFSTTVSDMDRFPLLRRVYLMATYLMATRKTFGNEINNGGDSELIQFFNFQTIGINAVVSTALPSSIAGIIRWPRTPFRQASSKRGKPDDVSIA